MLPRARRHHHASGAEKQQALEHRVIQHVRQTGGDRHGRQFGPPVRQRQHRRAQSEHDDPGILDRAVREKPLEIALRQRVQHAQDGRQRAEAHERETPAHGGNAEAERADSEETVDARR